MVVLSAVTAFSVIPVAQYALYLNRPLQSCLLPHIGLENSTASRQSARQQVSTRQQLIFLPVSTAFLLGGPCKDGSWLAETPLRIATAPRNCHPPSDGGFKKRYRLLPEKWNIVAAQYRLSSKCSQGNSSYFACIYSLGNSGLRKDGSWLAETPLPIATTPQNGHPWWDRGFKKHHRLLP